MTEPFPLITEKYAILLKDENVYDSEGGEDEDCKPLRILCYKLSDGSLAREIMWPSDKPEAALYEYVKG